VAHERRLRGRLRHRVPLLSIELAHDLAAAIDEFRRGFSEPALTHVPKSPAADHPDPALRSRRSQPVSWVRYVIVTPMTPI